MGRPARFAVAAVAAVLATTAAWAVEDADALGAWRVHRWLATQLGVAAVEDFRCGAAEVDDVSGSDGSTLLPQACATVRTDLDAAGLARFAGALAAYRDAHPTDPAGLVEVHGPWGASLVGFSEGDDWVLAAVRIATSVPGHGPVSIVGGEGRQTATVPVPTRDGLADLAADLSQQLPASGPPAAFPSGLGFVGPRGRVYVTGPTRLGELARTAFEEAAADTPDVAVLLRPGQEESPGFVVTLGPRATTSARERLTALGVGAPATRSWLEHRDRPVEVATELFSDEDPGAVTRPTGVESWNLGPERVAFTSRPGVDTAVLEERPGRVALSVLLDPDTWPPLVDLVADVPATATHVVLRRPPTLQTEPVLDVTVEDLVRIAPVVDAVVSAVRPAELSWAEDGSTTGSPAGPGLVVSLGDVAGLPPGTAERLLTTLAAPAAPASGAAWVEVGVAVDGDEWRYVLDLVGSDVALAPDPATQPTTAARARAAEVRLRARWRALRAAD